MKKKVTVSLGSPVTVPALVPVEHKSTPMCINAPFMVDGECYKVTAMLLSGLPHGAVFVDDVDGVDVPVLGSALGTHELFPKGASIVFIEALDKETLKARLWQQNEGEIEFSQTAVGVVGVAAMMLQKTLQYEVNVSMGENNFKVGWDRNGGDVSITPY